MLELKNVKNRKKFFWKSKKVRVNGKKISDMFLLKQKRKIA